MHNDDISLFDVAFGIISVLQATMHANISLIEGQGSMPVVRVSNNWSVRANTLNHGLDIFQHYFYRNHIIYNFIFSFFSTSF